MGWRKLAALQGVAALTVVPSEKSVGWSNALILGCIISAVYVFALNVAPTFTKYSSNSTVILSAGTPFNESNRLYETIS